MSDPLFHPSRNNKGLLFHYKLATNSKWPSPLIPLSVGRTPCPGSHSDTHCLCDKGIGRVLSFSPIHSFPSPSSHCVRRGRLLTDFHRFLGKFSKCWFRMRLNVGIYPHDNFIVNSSLISHSQCLRYTTKIGEASLSFSHLRLLLRLSFVSAD